MTILLLPEILTPTDNQIMFLSKVLAIQAINKILTGTIHLIGAAQAPEMIREETKIAVAIKKDAAGVIATMRTSIPCCPRLRNCR